MQKDNYKWYVMILGAVTNAVVVAIPGMGLSVLLPEISQDLHLDLVQAGLLWGIAAVPVIVSSLLAGVLCDRYGPKRVLIISCLMIGLTGALRGLSPNFSILLLTAFVCGFFGPLVTISSLKNAVIWFPASELGLANGIPTLGMAFGFFLGSMISAAYLSPALNGWRNVLILYGFLAMMMAVPWFFSRPVPADAQPATGAGIPFKQSMSQLLKIKELWFLGFALLGVSGAIQGLLGYLPLYLESLGWAVAKTGQALASFHISSMLFVIPLSLWSDKLRSRSKFLIGIALLTAVGMGILSFVEGAAIWLTLIVVGSVRDSFMAIFFTRVNETRGVERAFSALAVGFTMIFLGIGSLVGPPLGNSLATPGMPGAPLIFWAAMALAGGLFILLAFRQERVLVPARQESFEESNEIMEED